MSLALQQAGQAYAAGEIPVGAVVVASGRIIAKSCNQTEVLNDATAHAEMLAITAASGWLGSRYLKGCTLYVTLEPCPMCAAAAHWAQIDRIVYGAPDPKRGYSLFSPGLLHPKTLVRPGVLHTECNMLLEKFFRKLRR